MLPRRSGLVSAALAVAVVVGLVLPLPGQETDLNKKIQELNRLTGGAVLLGEYKSLVQDKDGTRKLIDHARELLKKDKNALNYNAAYVLAEAAKKFGDLKAAEDFYRACTRIAAKLESTNKLVQSYGSLIDLLYESGKYAESANVCRELLELETGPGKPRVVFIPVETRFGTLTFVEDTNYDALRRIKPGVHRLLIQAITKDGKFDRALKLIDNLIKSQDHWQERQLKGWVLREAGRYQEAADTYEDVLSRIVKDKELEPEMRQVYEDRVRYILSSVYVDLKKIDKAVEQLRALVARHPEEPGYYNDLGYIMADNDMNLEEAEKLIRKAIDLDRERRKKVKDIAPEENVDNGAYLDSLGWALYKQKKYKEAKEWLEKAVRDKKSQHIEIYDHLGDVLMALGERDAALKAWRRGLELAGESRREQDRKALVEKKIQKYSK